MAVRRSTAPRKRPAPTGADVAVPVRPAADGVSDTVQEAEQGNEQAALRKRLLERFESSLEDNRDIDDEGREYLMRHYRNAVETASLSPSLTARPDRSQWIETLEALRSGGLATDDDVASLIRQFDAAMEPLDAPQLRTLAEFSERVARDGQEAAVEWLESKRESLEESKRASAAAGSDARLQPSKPAPRRARSPRGPPVG